MAYTKCQTRAEFTIEHPRGDEETTVVGTNPPTAQEQKAIAMLKGDPQMRTAFINKIAAPIANKMFDCGMIP